jgi:hypothetical protein
MDSRNAKAAGRSAEGRGLPTARARELEREVARAATAPVASDVADALRERLQAEQGGNLVALIFYGSRLNDTAGPRSDWDFFVIVERYRQAHASRLHAVLNRILPPSIYRRELPLPGGSVAHCKLSLLSFDDLHRYTSPAAPDSYVFGRLSKRVALLHARDEAARSALVVALARSVTVCAGWALKEQPEYASAEDFARAAVAFSYRCEERVEGSARAVALFDADAPYFSTVYAAALHEAQDAGRVRLDAETGRVVRSGRGEAGEPVARFVGRSRRRARLRWLKNAWTFQGWDDYMLAKLERHQGLQLALTERERRHPMLAAVRHYLRLRREGRLSRDDRAA